MKSNFERAKAHMERAYKTVSSLKISGDVVDIVYEIREELRQAYRMVCEGEKEQLNDAARPDSSVSACGAATFPSQGKAPSQSPAATALPKGEPSRGELCSPAEDDGQTQEVSGDAAAEDEV